MTLAITLSADCDGCHTKAEWHPSPAWHPAAAARLEGWRLTPTGLAYCPPCVEKQGLK